MHRRIPQANLMNPAFFNETKKVVVGIPLLSSAYLGFQSPVSWDETFKQTPDDSLEIDPDGILAQIQESNRLDLDANIALLFVGVRVGKGVMTVGINTRVDGGLAIPGDLISFLLEGQGDDPSDVFTINLADTDFRYQVFNELYGGYNMRINPKLVVGGRIKLLSGLFNANLDNFGGSISVSIDSINIQSNAFTLQTAGFDDPSPSYYTFGSGNRGLAFDFGATYEVMDNLYISASALDLGFINWKDNVKTYEFDEVNYTFEGVDFLELIEDDDNDNEDNLIDQELDSLKDLYDPTELSDPYRNPLVPKFYLGGHYRLANIHQFGVLFYGDVFQSNLRGSFGFSYDLTLSKILSVGVNASYKNGKFDNIGTGLSLMFGPVQIYGAADRLNTVLNPEKAKLYSFRVGLNLAFGTTTDGSMTGE